MKAKELLAELERLNAILDDPNADNTAGRVETIQYDILPTLMRQERHLILQALRAYVKPSHFQTELLIP
jgi:hypothetical protein